MYVILAINSYSNEIIISLIFIKTLYYNYITLLNYTVMLPFGKQTRVLFDELIN